MKPLNKSVQKTTTRNKKLCKNHTVARRIMTTHQSGKHKKHFTNLNSQDDK